MQIYTNILIYILLAALTTTQVIASPYIPKYGMVEGVRSDFLNAPSGKGPVIIKEDNGGDLTYYLRAAKKYHEEKREVRIEGDCYSSCFLALSLRNVCVTENATVYAHAFKDMRTGKTAWPITYKILALLPRKLAMYYAENLRAEFYIDGNLTGSELIALGIKPCRQLSQKKIKS